MGRCNILASPIKVGNVVMKNHLMTTSMSPGYGYVINEVPTQRFYNYLEERAAGGTALICQTVSPFHREFADESALHVHPLPGAFSDDHLPGLRKMAEVVHKHGSLLVGQPWTVHAWKPDDEEHEKPWGPTPQVILKGMPPFTPMEKRHIDMFINHYVMTARYIKKAGWDGVEIMAGVGGVMNRFMSPATNNRTDEYGGSFENRMRFVLEVIRAVRAEVGPDYLITCRWSPVEYVSSELGEGNDIENALKVAPLLEEAGVDMHNLAIGWHESSIPLTIKTVPDGYWSWVSEKIKTVAKKPVACAYRNTDPLVMEQILQEKKADIIAGLRYNIADPEFGNKVMEDRLEDLNKCICCCRCLDDVVSSGKVLEYCGVNPRLGKELDRPRFEKTKDRKRVMVIGSGPGGLSAAVTACEQGHQVTVYERGPRVGGCLVMSSIFSPTYERLLVHYKHELKKHPQIKVKLNTKVTRRLVARERPDAVIVAIGGEPVGLDVPGADGKNVVLSHDFLEMLNGKAPKKPGLINKVMWTCGSIFLKFYYTPAFARLVTGVSPWPIGKNVAIIGGGLPGCELGTLLLKYKRKMTIFEERKKVGWDVGGSDRFHVTSAFKESEDCTLEPLTKVTEITGKGVKAVRQDGTEFFVPANTVAVTLGFKKNLALANSLKGMVEEIAVVGDCVNPARMADATKAGYLAARNL